MSQPHHDFYKSPPLNRAYFHPDSGSYYHNRLNSRKPWQAPEVDRGDKKARQVRIDPRLPSPDSPPRYSPPKKLANECPHSSASNEEQKYVTSTENKLDVIGTTLPDKKADAGVPRCPQRALARMTENNADVVGIAPTVAKKADADVPCVPQRALARTSHEISSPPWFLLPKRVDVKAVDTADVIAPSTRTDTVDFARNVDLVGDQLCTVRKVASSNHTDTSVLHDITCENSSISGQRKSPSSSAEALPSLDEDTPSPIRATSVNLSPSKESRSLWDNREPREVLAPVASSRADDLPRETPSSPNPKPKKASSASTCANNVLVASASSGITRSPIVSIGTDKESAAISCDTWIPVPTYQSFLDIENSNNVPAFSSTAEELEAPTGIGKASVPSIVSANAPGNTLSDALPDCSNAPVSSGTAEESDAPTGIGKAPVLFVSDKAPHNTLSDVVHASPGPSPAVPQSPVPTYQSFSDIQKSARAVSAAVLPASSDTADIAIVMAMVDRDRSDSNVDSAEDPLGFPAGRNMNETSAMKIDANSPVSIASPRDSQSISQSLASFSLLGRESHEVSAHLSVKPVCTEVAATGNDLGSRTCTPTTSPGTILDVLQSSVSGTQDINNSDDRRVGYANASWSADSHAGCPIAGSAEQGDEVEHNFFSQVKANDRDQAFLPPLE